jgi:NAD(P)-dependent dehydrogenase (short-subunit alcohol dehydrogenase family)
MISSTAHQAAFLDFDKLNDPADFNGARAYAVSKLCNVLFTRELARRLEGLGVTANCLEPGLVATALGDEVGGPMGMWLANAKRSRGVSPAEGARTVVYLAAAPEVAGVSGGYFRDCQVAEPAPTARDAECARVLWQVSAEIADRAGTTRRTAQAGRQ